MVMRRNALGFRAPETSAVGEQESHVFTDTGELQRHHFARARQAAKNYRQLAGLPEDLQAEAVGTGIPIYPGPKSDIASWVNHYTQSVFPFTTDGTSQRVLPANPLRTYLLVQNNSAGILFMNIGHDATQYGGIQLAASGGFYEIIGGATGGAHIPYDDIYILGSVGGLQFVVSEGIFVPVVSF